MPTALGLLVAIPAFMCYRHFASKVDTFDIQIENASGEVLTYVMLQLRRRN